MPERPRHRAPIVWALLLIVPWAGCPSADPSAATLDASQADSLGDQGAVGSLLQTQTAAVSTSFLPTEACGIPLLASELATQVVAKVNEIRVGEGLVPLTINETLTTVAEDYACQHIEDNFYELLGGENGEGLSHCHPLTCGLGTGYEQGPGERAIEAGYVFRIIGENLAGGQRTADEVVADWMASPGHRDNILAPHWTETGVGIRTGGHFGVYWVQMFGLPF